MKTYSHCRKCSARLSRRSDDLGTFDGLCSASKSLSTSCFELADAWITENIPDAEEILSTCFDNSDRMNRCFYASDWWTVAVDRWLEETATS